MPAILALNCPPSSANWPTCDPATAPGAILAPIPDRGGLGKEMKEFAGLYYREGALDPKTMQLVALAAMAAAGCTS